MRAGSRPFVAAAGPAAARLCRRPVGAARHVRTSSARMQQYEQQQPPAEQAASSGDLWQRVLAVYDAAQQTGAATKTDTQVQECRDSGINFVLRIAAALRAKPKGIAGSGTSSTTASQQQQPAAAAPAAFRNPFLPYEQELWCSHLSVSHTLLLNKFNVVPHHVLVVTREFESQGDPLNARDLAATQQVLAAMPHGGVAFYNCGEHSGRSQPHKHLQVVPLPFNEQPGQQCQAAAGPPMQQLVMEAAAAAGAQPLQPFAIRQLPFRAYAVLLQPETSAPQLAAAAEQLLSLCQAGLAAPVSYNVVMAVSEAGSFLLMVPRSREMCGSIAINSLGFAGTILLRSAEDLAFALQQQPLNILAHVAQPWDTEPAASGL